MTAPAPLDLPALLDDLERAHAAATPGPWEVREDHGRDISDEGWSFIRVVQPNGDEVATTWPIGHERHEPEADAAAIVALHNAVPTLIAELRKRDAALRRVLSLMDFADGTGRVVFGISDGGAVWVRDIRAALTAALSPESVQS